MFAQPHSPTLVLGASWRTMSFTDKVLVSLLGRFLLQEVYGLSRQCYATSPHRSCTPEVSLDEARSWLITHLQQRRSAHHSRNRCHRSEKERSGQMTIMKNTVRNCCAQEKSAFSWPSLIFLSFPQTLNPHPKASLMSLRSWKMCCSCLGSLKGSWDFVSEVTSRL